MLDAIANIILLALMVVIITIIFVSGWKNDFREPPCDYDCDHCPFPKCSDEQIERWKENDLHNR